MKNLIFLITILFMGASQLHANLRAPYNKTFESGGQIFTGKGFKVLSSELSFHFDKYYTGKLGTVMKTGTISCRVTAVYNIESGDETAAEFTFITPSTNNFFAKVNNRNVTTIIESKRPQSTDIRFGELKESQYIYTVKFNSPVREGNNRIEVSYLQPVSVYESRYGYFTKSRWYSSVEYQYWPIKEWERDKAFNTRVTVSVPYNWSVLDYINGADIEIRGKGFNKVFDKQYKRKISKEIKLISTKPKKNGKKLFRSFIIRDNLPDILQIGIQER